jgi:hypothetical protein
LSRAIVELGGDDVEVVLGELTDVQSARQVLAKQPIGVLVAAAADLGSQKKTVMPVSMLKR